MSQSGLGQKFSWLVRLIKPGRSWGTPGQERSNDNQTAVDQVKALAAQNSGLKVVVADSLYANQVFLAVFLVGRSSPWSGYART